MSRITHSRPRRSFVVPGLVLIGLAASAATAQAQSTDPERALLNRIPVSHRVTVAGTQSSTPIDGARVLLNSSTVAAGPSKATGELRAVDGAQALLGAASPAGPRLTLAW